MGHRIVHPRKQKERRNRASGIPANPGALEDVFVKLTGGDPRRITDMVFRKENSRFHVSALPEGLSLADKWDRPSEHDAPQDLHIAYVGTTGSFIVVRLDARLVVPELFRTDQIKEGETVPPVNTLLNTMRRWKRPYADVLPIVPHVNDHRKYRWLIGRKWFVQAGLIGGRGIQHIRVVDDLGILATNGTNSLYFLEMERIWQAAEVNEPLPADRASWTEVFRGQGGAISFMTPVYRQEGVGYISLYNQSGQRIPFPTTSVA